MTPDQRTLFAIIGTVLLFLLAMGVTEAKGQDRPGLQVDPALEREWFRHWEQVANESVWCGYGGVEDGDVVISHHEKPEVLSEGPTGAKTEPCPPAQKGDRLVAAIHTHPSMTQLKERMPKAAYLKIKAWRGNRYRRTEYECELSQTDRRTFAESRYREMPLLVSIVVCAPRRYVYRTRDNIYGGKPVIVQRGKAEENTDG